MSGAAQGDGVYMWDGRSMYNDKARYIHEKLRGQEIIWLKSGGTCWHIATDRKQPTHGAYSYDSTEDDLHPALNGWETEYGAASP